MSVMIHKQTTPTVHLTEAAIDRLVVCANLESNSRAVRLSLKKSGCSGLSYVISYINEPQPDDVVLPLRDDMLFCIDRIHVPYLNGLRIDYVKQGLNHKFVFDNPNQTGLCGCGESFTVE